MDNIRFFTLDFSSEGKTNAAGNIPFARFSFYFDGVPYKGVSCVISGRAAGNMGLAADALCGGVPSGENPARKALFETLGLDYGRASFLKQVHSRKVLETKRGNLLRGETGDGLASGDRSVILSVTVADCLPVFLLDTESGALSLLHSGWKGTGIVLNALSLMKEKWGTRPGAIAAILGPCIRSCCYRVDEERAEAFEREFGLPNLGTGVDSSPVPRGAAFPLGPPALRRNDGFYLDLQAANAKLLSGAGVRNIAVCGDCTFTDERLGSFRREGPSYTRMLALAGYF